MEILVNPKYQHDTELQQLLHRLPEAFDANEGELIYDKRNKLRRFVLSSGKVLVVKRYKRPNIIQRISYSWFTPNKAQKAFRFGSRLLQMDIDTPEPIAAVTIRHNTMVKEYFFASAEDTRPSCWLINEQCGNQTCLPLGYALAAYMVELHSKGFLHGDTNLSNFLYETTDTGYHFAVIDINRSRFVEGREPSKEECLKNFFRLSHNREVIKNIVSEYARLRGWNPEEAVADVIRRIERFEHKKEILSHFK